MTTDHNPKRMEVHRTIDANTPESLRVDFEKLQNARVYMPEAVNKRLTTLILECKDEIEVVETYNKGALVFIVVMLVGALLPIGGAIVLWIGGVVGWLFLNYKSSQLRTNLEKKMGFVDGLFFVISEVAHDLKQKSDELAEEEERTPEQQAETKTENPSATIK